MYLHPPFIIPILPEEKKGEYSVSLGAYYWNEMKAINWGLQSSAMFIYDTTSSCAMSLCVFLNTSSTSNI